MLSYDLALAQLDTSPKYAMQQINEEFHSSVSIVPQQIEFLLTSASGKSLRAKS
jgi:hypothetical protein